MAQTELFPSFFLLKLPAADQVESCLFSFSYLKIKTKMLLLKPLSLGRHWYGLSLVGMGRYRIAH